MVRAPEHATDRPAVPTRASATSALAIDGTPAPGPVDSAPSVPPARRRRGVAADPRRGATAALFRALSEHITDLVLILEADGTIRYASPSHLRLLGYTPIQMEGHNAAEFVHPADLPAVQARTVATARVRDAVETMIFRIRHADGSWRTLEAVGANRLRDPVVRGWIVTSRDITERLRMETEIRRSEERLRGIIDGSSAMICLTDLHGRYVLVNREVERFYGRERTAIEGQIAYDVLPVEVRDLHRIQDRLVIERAAEVVAEEQVHRDGALRTYLMQKFPLRDEHGTVYAIAGIATDITPRAQMEAALQERERQLGEAQRVAHIGSFEWDAVANRVSWSDELYRIYGLDPQSFGATFEAFVAQVHPDDRVMVMDTIQQAIAVGGPFRMQERIVRPSGELRYLSSWGEVVCDAQGRPVRLLGICQDVTTQRQQEDEVRHLNETLEQRVAERTAQLREANEQLEAFSYSVSHDLRAPLRAMQGFAAALLEDYADQLDAEGQEYARRIDAAAARMDLLIADLLAYSRLSRAAITVQPVALDAVLASALAFVEEDLRQRQAQVRVTAGLPRVSAHYATLVQVVTNLLTNAAKFVAPGKRAEIAVEAEACGSWIRLWVEDTGIGIAPEHRERIFGVFERLHGVEAYPGTGIGLAIVRKGIERLGGRVGLESTVGAGSRFWIELPTAEKPMP